LSVLLLEIAILENVRSGADEAETHVNVAGVTEGKLGAPEHNDFVRLPVIAAVDDLVNSGFANRIAGPHLRTVGGGTAA